MELFARVYMIRAGDFGTDFDLKLVMALCAVALVSWDVVRRRRWDYLWVLAAGTITWSAAELILQATGTRVMEGGELLGHPVPLWLGVILQGMSEGAAIAVGGIFVGDRLLDRRTRTWTAVAFLALCAFVVARTLAVDVAVESMTPSRRNMTALPALAALSLFMAVNVFFWLRSRAFRRRAAAMAAVMVVFAALWTAGEVAAGTRWIEIDGASLGTYARAPGALAFAALSFDVVIEIALAYVPFFAVPAMLGRIEPDPPLREG